jgi:acetyl-CoA acetyltransferase
MQDVYVIGSASTHFKRWPERDFDDLVREAYLHVIQDAALADGHDIQSVYFGNCAMDQWGQSNIRGQVCFMPLIKEGLHAPQAPICNVESGCATGSMSFHSACKDIASGQSELSLAIAAEKTFFKSDPSKTLAMFQGGADQVHRSEWMDYFHKAAEDYGLKFKPHSDRVLFLDVYAMQAEYHMKKYGTTREQIAASAAKNHAHGALNPKAQYRKAMTVEEVLSDFPIVGPFTRSMCSPISDGAASLLVCSKSWLDKLPPSTARRAIKVRACASSNGRYRSLDEPSLTRHAATKAYAQAGLSPKDIDLVELHDSTSFCEIYQLEMLGLCEEGQGGPLIADGSTQLGGRLPVNLSGGLVSKGHPLAATGLSMLDELVLQLREEAGERQVKGAKWGLKQNAGGQTGFDEAACAVTILEK